MNEKMNILYIVTSINSDYLLYDFLSALLFCGHYYFYLFGVENVFAKCVVKYLSNRSHEIFPIIL